MHVLGDALASVGAVLSGVIIKFVNHPAKFYADPALSIVLALIVSCTNNRWAFTLTPQILKGAVPLVKHCTNILMQSVPENFEMEKISGIETSW